MTKGISTAIIVGVIAVVVASGLYVSSNLVDFSAIQEPDTNTQTSAEQEQIGEEPGMQSVEEQPKEESETTPTPTIPSAEQEPEVEGLGTLCSSQFECFFYCQKNLQACADYCNKNPSNSLCKAMQSMLGGSATPSSSSTLDLSKPLPKFVKNDFIELSKIQRISKFRSGYGHDFSQGTEETCRSMKHYYWQKGGEPSKPHTFPWMSVKYFAPVDGTIKFVQYRQNQTGGTEAQFYLESSEYPAISFRFFHVRLLDSIKSGTKVSAGQEIGTVGDEDAHGEIGVNAKTTEGTTLIPYFDVVDDSLFEEYKKRGAKSRQDFIITKEFRDSKSLQCDPNTEEGRFIGASIDGLKDSTGTANFFELK